MSTILALGLLLALGGLAGLAVGLYALLRGGRDQQGGGLGPFSERGVHAVAGLRMIVGGVVTFFFGIVILWSYSSG